MSDAKQPDELQDPARRGISLRLVGHIGSVPLYRPQVGSVPCCRCTATAENLYGTIDAPLCTVCIGEIVTQWCTQHVKDVRRELGLTDDSRQVADGAEYQGKRPDQVAFSEAVAALCFGLSIVVVIGLLVWRNHA
jgi:hypothetical protein